MLNQMFGKMYNAGKFDCKRSFIFLNSDGYKFVYSVWKVFEPTRR